MGSLNGAVRALESHWLRFSSSALPRAVPSKANVGAFMAGILGSRPRKLHQSTLTLTSLCNKKTATSLLDFATTKRQTVVCRVVNGSRCRISPSFNQRQQRSGLGIEAQRCAIERFAAAEGLTIIGEYTEAETGKGADPWTADRNWRLPWLWHAKPSAASSLRSSTDCRVTWRLWRA